MVFKFYLFFYCKQLGIKRLAGTPNICIYIYLIMYYTFKYYLICIIRNNTSQIRNFIRILKYSISNLFFMPCTSPMVDTSAWKPLTKCLSYIFVVEINSYLKMEELKIQGSSIAEQPWRHKNKDCPLTSFSG